MLGSLSQEGMMDVLKQAYHGHLGCAGNNVPYVVPLSFVFDGEFIISHTGEGKKVNLMRENPSVCFQVELVSAPGNWKSVIVNGTFEEVKSESERERYMKLLLKRILPQVPEAMTRPHEPAASKDRRESEGLSEIIFRIRISSMSGRFEKT